MLQHTDVVQEDVISVSQKSILQHVRTKKIFWTKGQKSSQNVDIETNLFLRK